MTYKVPSYLKFYDSLGMVISESCVAGRKLGVGIRLVLNLEGGQLQCHGMTVGNGVWPSWWGSHSARTFKKGLGIGHVIRKSNES